MQHIIFSGGSAWCWFLPFLPALIWPNQFLEANCSPRLILPRPHPIFVNPFTTESRSSNLSPLQTMTCKDECRSGQVPKKIGFEPRDNIFLLPCSSLGFSLLTSILVLNLDPFPAVQGSFTFILPGSKGQGADGCATDPEDCQQSFARAEPKSSRRREGDHPTPPLLLQNFYSTQFWTPIFFYSALRPERLIVPRIVSSPLKRHTVGFNLPFYALKNTAVGKFNFLFLGGSGSPWSPVWI